MPACGWTLTEWPAGSPAATTEQKATAEAAAAHTLWALSGRVFGVCEVTVSPVVEPVQPSTYDGPYGAVSRWPGRAGCGCVSACRCVVSQRRVHLPGPVQAVTSVAVAGVTLDADQYEVHNRRWLVRLDGLLWPLYTGDPHAFTVTYMRGLPIPDGAMRAFGDLAAHYLGQLVSTGQCSIPVAAQSISRQGVDIQLIDPEDLAAVGRTGVASADQWLAEVNPSGQRRAPSRVFSPDRPEPIRIG